MKAKDMMKKLMVIAALAGASALPMVSLAAETETLCSGVAAEVKLDLATGTRIPAATETLTYSTEWDGGSEVTLAVNGTTLASGLTGSGTFDWTPSGIGLFTLTHTTATGSGDVVLTALFEIPTVTFTPEPLANTTVAVYTNGAAVAKTGDDYVILSNVTATAVYTAEGGCYFADGTAAKTNALDTTVDPAVVKGGTPAAPAEPSVMVGKPAQRYPWNGIVDVPYRVKNWPAGGAGYKVKFTVQVGEAAPVDGGTTAPAAGGTVTGMYAIDFKALNLPLDLGEATVKAAIVAE